MTIGASAGSGARPLPLRTITGAIAMAAMSPAPWAVASLVHARGEATLVAIGLLMFASLPVARWAFGSWSAVAIAGSVLNLFWFYSVFVDPSAGPWASLFLAAPYLAFTVSGLIGWFEKPATRIRWVGAVLPPVLYFAPFFLAECVNAARCGSN